MQSSDFNSRKMAVDVVFTIAKMMPHVLKESKRDLCQILTDLKFDKMKPVREAAVEALNAFKDVPEPEFSK